MKDDNNKEWSEIMCYKFNELGSKAKEKAINNHRYDDLAEYIREFNPSTEEINYITSDIYVSDFLQENGFLFDVAGNDW